MNEIKNSSEEDGFSSFSHLPEEIVLQILSKLTDLKILCRCKLVSKRFYQIVLQVETISYTFSTDDLGSYGSAIGSLMEFEKVKFVFIQLPSSFEGRSLFKWKFNFEAKHRSFLFLSPNSIFHKKQTHVGESGQEEDIELTRKKSEIAELCLKDAMTRVGLLFHIIRLPLLEKVLITDLRNRGKVSLSGEKVAELSNWLYEPCNGSIEKKWKFANASCRSSKCYVPLLELPVSGYVMKGVFLYVLEWDGLSDDNYKSFIMCHDDEDKEQVAFSEAVTEIFEKHSSTMKRLIA